jgi:DNA-binding transcriptional LysR family regulator
MDFIWFRDLRNLADVGNFSEAAKLSSISQPAFSRRIKALEEWVGTSLVDRTTHPAKLTAAGLQMLEVGEQALSRLETERAQIRDALSLPDQYVVTFGAQHSIGWRFFPTWLQAFETTYGPFMSRLRADDLPNCFADLKNREIDFVISFASSTDNNITQIPKLQSLAIGKDALVPVCKALPDGKPVFDLDDEASGMIPFLRFGQSAPISRHIESLMASPRLKGRLNVVYENSMVGALRVRARDGHGIAWLPRSLILPDLEAGHLALAGRYNWSVELDIRIYRLEANANQLTRKIWDFLAAREAAPLTGS